jgi:hypothetical protein
MEARKYVYEVSIIYGSYCIIILATGTCYCGLCSKLYCVFDSLTGDTKSVHKGSRANPNEMDLSFQSYRRALFRPKHFMDMIRKLNLTVLGEGKLVKSDGSEITDVESGIIHQFLLEDQLIEDQSTVSNFTIKRNPKTNELFSTSVNKKMHSNVYLKRTVGTHCLSCEVDCLIHTFAHGL